MNPDYFLERLKMPKYREKIKKIVRLLYMAILRSIKLRSREALWKLHRNFYVTQKTPWRGIRDNQLTATVSRAHFLTLCLANKAKSNSIVLDAGCNNGNIGRHLIKKGCFVYGIDISPRLVEEAKMKGLFASVCPVEELTFQDNFFDYCLAFEILEHLYNPEEGLKELYRVLKVGGTLFGSVPCPSGKFSKSSKYQWIWHQHDFNKKSLERLLLKFFDLKKITVTGHLVYKDNAGYKLFFEVIK